MAQGDVVGGTSSLAATTGTLDIKPGAGVEWVIHNVYYAATGIKLSMTDGTNVIDFETDNAQGARMGMMIHVSNAYWLRLSNTSGSALLVAYDGIQTK
jgi:hypothetical protein